MSRGKYSPACPVHAEKDAFKYNCYGQEPEPWSGLKNEPDREYNSATMMCGYDENGYDSYGYSAFDRVGNFVGHGCGVDPNGYTENDYLTLQDIPEPHRSSYYFYCA